jgi:tetratricopeptide (TPR) repeat protein
MNDAQQRALEGLSDILFTAPETPIRLGSGDLSMYRDVATLDPGPGYLNGILSLILNSTGPVSEFPQEEQSAAPYFRRSQAAQLLAVLDGKFPASPRRAELHVKLLNFYAASGEGDAVLRGGAEFLAAFPKDSQRTAVALLMADAYARAGKTQDEFAIYDSVLQELAARADRVPLGERVAGGSRADNFVSSAFPTSPQPASGNEGEGSQADARATANASAFQVNSGAAPGQVGARSPEYARVLERYLARLAQLKQIPQALVVLRREIDRNPNDPGLYERLAQFLQQNRLGAEEEEIYQRAMARFPDRSWYQKRSGKRAIAR